MDGGSSGDWEAERLKLLMEVDQLRREKCFIEQALRDTRNELLEAREEICALNGDDEEHEPADFNDGLESDVRRGY